MEIYTQKAIKNFVKKGCAEDITNYGVEKMNEFLKSHDLEKVGCSCGIYGFNGGVD